MTPLLASLFGLLGSFMPNVLSFFERSQQHRHEMDLMQLSAKLQQSAHTTKLEELSLRSHQAQQTALLEHDTNLSDPALPIWVDCLRALVRPALTFGSLFLYGLLLIWSSEAILTSAAFAGLESMTAAVWAFWFGDRMIRRRS